MPAANAVEVRTAGNDRPSGCRSGIPRNPRIAAFTIMPGDEIASPQQLLKQATKAKNAAGCGDVTTTPPYDPESQDRIHVDPNSGPPLSSYPTTPPASGPHAD